MEYDASKMHYEMERLYTFNQMKFLNIAQKLKLARRNFYIKYYDMNSSDMINCDPVCYKCNSTIENGCHELDKKHTCTPVPNSKSNIPMQSPYVSDTEYHFMNAKSPVHFPEIRLATFGNWPAINRRLRIEFITECAMAGYFFIKKPCRVECYFCQEQLDITIYLITHRMCNQIIKPSTINDCNHNKHFEAYMAPAKTFTITLGQTMPIPQKCSLCQRYKYNLKFQTYYHVESCYECAQNMRSIVSPSLLPTYKVNFEGRLTKGRRKSVN